MIRLSHPSKILLLSLGFSIFLIASRIIYAGSLYYIFLVWNLFLAGVPFFFSSILRKKENLPGIIQFVLFFLWLIFFPNAPYIITDFLHLGESPRVPRWFDVILLFTASWNGLLLGLLSLFRIEQYLVRIFSKKWVPLIMVVSLFLSGFGVYLGRYLRWNSWEIFTQPADILQDSVIRVIRPLDYPSTWGITFFFGIFLTILFYTVRYLNLQESKSVSLREL